MLHTQFGVWLTTRHSAFDPHEPGQGSLHFWLMQAKLLEHSLLLIHSGLQFGGAPINSGKQEQDGESPETLHCELGPQGDGWQGLTGTTTISSEMQWSCDNFLAITLDKLNYLRMI